MFALTVIASLCLTSHCRAEAVLLQGCGRLLPDHPTWLSFPNSCKYTASYFVTQCENALSLATLFYPRALHHSSWGTQLQWDCSWPSPAWQTQGHHSPKQQMWRCSRTVGQHKFLPLAVVWRSLNEGQRVGYYHGERCQSSSTSLRPSQKAQVHLFSPFPVLSACSLTQPNTRCPFGLFWHHLLNFGGCVRARVCLQAPPEVKLLQKLHSCKRHTTTMPPMGRAVSCCLLPGSF